MPEPSTMPESFAANPTAMRVIRFWTRLGVDAVKHVRTGTEGAGWGVGCVALIVALFGSGSVLAARAFSPESGPTVLDVLGWCAFALGTLFGLYMAARQLAITYWTHCDSVGAAAATAIAGIRQEAEAESKAEREATDRAQQGWKESAESVRKFGDFFQTAHERHRALARSYRALAAAHKDTVRDWNKMVASQDPVGLPGPSEADRAFRRLRLARAQLIDLIARGEGIQTPDLFGIQPDRERWLAEVTRWTHAAFTNERLAKFEAGFTRGANGQSRQLEALSGLHAALAEFSSDILDPRFTPTA